MGKTTGQFGSRRAYNNFKGLSYKDVAINGANHGKRGQNIIVLFHNRYGETVYFGLRYLLDAQKHLRSDITSESDLSKKDARVVSISDFSNVCSHPLSSVYAEINKGISAANGLIHRNRGARIERQKRTLNQ